MQETKKKAYFQGNLRDWAKMKMNLNCLTFLYNGKIGFFKHVIWFQKRQIMGHNIWLNLQRNYWKNNTSGDPMEKC